LDDLNTTFDNLETNLSKLETENSHLKSRFDLLEIDYFLFKQKSSSLAFEIELFFIGKRYNYKIY